MSYTQIYYQIVFRTKYNIKAIPEEHCQELYKYMWGIIESTKSKLYRINGVADHIHIFCDLHPSIALADFVKRVKTGSSLWMKQTTYFPLFKGWVEGYGAFTYSIRERDMIINYVKKQKRHHNVETSGDEFKRLLMENGIEFDETYLP